MSSALSRRIPNGAEYTGLRSNYGPFAHPKMGSGFQHFAHVPCLISVRVTNFCTRLLNCDQISHISETQ